MGTGLRDFERTGQALAEIRDNGFYRATHESFEAYLLERWGFNTKQADRLIDAAGVVRVLAPLGVQPRSERQARAMKAAAKIVTELEPEGQRMVARMIEEKTDADTPPWEESAPELKIMASVVQKMTPETTVYHPESGDEVPFDSLSSPQRYEVIRTHVDQKTQAYHEKQAAKAMQEPAEKINWASWCMEYAQQGLTPEQRLEIVLEQGEKGKPVIHARVVDKETGEVLVEGVAAGQMRKAVLGLLAEVKG